MARGLGRGVTTESGRNTISSSSSSSDWEPALVVLIPDISFFLAQGKSPQYYVCVAQIRKNELLSEKHPFHPSLSIIFTQYWRE